MNLTPLNGILIGMVCLIAIADMVYWWVATRGTWWDWPAGKAQMALLAIIAAITGNAAVNIFLVGRYYYQPLVYAFLYSIMIGALVYVGMVIRSESSKERNGLPPNTDHRGTNGAHQQKKEANRNV